MKQIFNNSYLKSFKFSSYQEVEEFLDSQKSKCALALKETFGNNYFCYVCYHSLTRDVLFTLTFSSDADAEKYIKIFTFLEQKTIETLITEHKEAPHMRLLQKRLAEEITLIVHSQADLDNAIKASGILFGKSTSEDLKGLDATTFLDIFDGVPTAKIDKNELGDVGIISALAEKTGFLKSNGEARRALKENAISVNKTKVKEDYLLSENDLINDQFILLQKGKKNYYVIQCN